MSDPGHLLARSIRLAVVQNIYDQGFITAPQALTLLQGPLTPGDAGTIFDDSAQLQIKIRKPQAYIVERCDRCGKEVYRNWLLRHRKSGCIKGILRRQNE
jgi:hypothetical protein